MSNKAFLNAGSGVTAKNASHSTSWTEPREALTHACQAKLVSLDSLPDFDVLATISYGKQFQNAAPIDITIDAPQFNELPLIEVWHSDQPIERGSINHLRYSKNSAVLLGWLEVPQAGNSLETTTFDSVSAILATIKQLGYPHLLRTWNYIPRINSAEDGIERYRSFCLGRQRAFARGAFPNHLLPAASAVGSSDDNLKIVFLASTVPGVAQENPRQLSAYHYPRQYGPASPSFARATLLIGKDAAQFFVSGTASIVGHESIHAHDVIAQLDTILMNITRLIEEAAKNHNLPLSLNNITLAKVYIRHPEHYKSVRERLEKSLPEGVAVLYLQADICRDNLSLEIEIICSCER